MKSFALACLAASADALIKTSFAEVASLSPANNKFSDLKAGHIEYGYDGTALYINVSLSATIATLPTVDGDTFQLFAAIPYNSSSHIISVGCSWAISAVADPDNYAATWAAHI